MTQTYFISRTITYSSFQRTGHPTKNRNDLFAPNWALLGPLIKRRVNHEYILESSKNKESKYKRKISSHSNAGAYGMCRGALAWQQKEIEGLKTTIFDGELKQAARVRVKQMARKIYRYRKEYELTNEI